MRRILALLPIFLSCSVAWSQTEDKNPLKFNVIPPAPEAAALGKYIDMPVNAYTGVPKIEIPLYELKSYELKLPITLSYHASGMKWEEMPSWVGAGWSLAPGGMVSRTIRGRNDEEDGTGYLSTSTDISSFFNSNGSFKDDNFDWVNTNCSPYHTDEYNRILKASQNVLDLEPDLFFFSLPDGQSAKFVFGRNLEKKFIPHQYVNLDYVSYTNDDADFDYWKAIGKDGTIYIFEDREQSKSWSYCGTVYQGLPDTFPSPDVEAVSTWKLSKMISANELDTISFTYVEDSIGYETNTSVTEYNAVSGTLSAPASSTCLNQTSHFTRRLSLIETSAGFRVEFIAESEAESGADILEEVRIYYQDSLIKKYVMNYDGAPSLLSEVQEFLSYSEISTPSHQFTYWDVAEAPTYSRTSFSLDHWGYYNGISNAKKAAPVIYQGIYYGGANREPNLEACRWGTLKEIKYPTGGISSFEYELNDYSNYPEFGDLLYSPGLEQLAALQFTITSNVNDNYQNTVNFSLTDTTDIIIVYEVPGVPGGGIPSSGCHGTLTKSGGGFTTVNFLSGQGVSDSRAAISQLLPGSYSIYAEFTPSLWTWGGATPFSGLQFFIKVYKVKSFAEQHAANQLKGGGLRIKRIVNEGDQTLSKTFYYVDHETGLSSGKLMSFPRYSYLAAFDDGFMGGSTCYVNTSGGILVRSNACSVPLGVSQGAHVGYDEVIEFHGDSTANNGYTIHKFTNTTDEMSIGFPFFPNHSFAYKNGLLLEQEHYTTNGRLVQRTSNEYTYTSDPGPTVAGVKVAQYRNGGCTGCVNRTLAGAAYVELTEKVQLTKTVSRNYDMHLDSYLETESELTYDYADQVVQKVEKISNDTSRRRYSVYEYHDVLKTTPVKEYSMYSIPYLHSIDPHIQFIAGTKRTIDETYLKTSAVYLIEPVFSNYHGANADALGLFKRRLQFLSFDSRGHVTSFKKEDDPSVTSLIWGYNVNYPIAQVDNSGSGKVAHTSFESQDDEGNFVFAWNPHTYSKTGARSQLLTDSSSVGITGLSSSTTYILTYWAKDGDPSLDTTPVSLDDPTADANGWKYYEKIITGEMSVQLTGSSGGIYLDELRLYPIGARMTTYTYNVKNGGITSTTDVNNSTTYYDYNDRHQLEYVKDPEKNIVKRIEYRYSRDN